MFELFDPKGELRVTAGRLPHWYQPGATYFVTFRTADSMPREVTDLWHRHRRDWLLRHRIDPNDPSWRSALDQLPRAAVREFHETFSREFLDGLDKGFGECVLRQAELAAEVSSALLHFDGSRYQMGDFVVMPNHVHLLVGLLDDTDIERLCFSWKKFSATKINRALGRKGEFWQPESFDHLVRSSEQFEAIRRYIEENPLKAGLRPGEYLYYRMSAM